MDRRTDIWAFGCVLYEMRSGHRAFDSDDVADTLAAVLRAEVDWGALPRDVHPRLREVVERCLEKDVRRRFRDIGDVRVDLERVQRDTGWTSQSSRASGAGARTLSNWAWAVTIALAIVASSAA